MIYDMLLNVRTSQERFQAFQNITKFSPSSKLRLTCEQALVTSPSIRVFLRPRVTLGEEGFARGPAWEFLMALKDKRELAEGSRQKQFE